MKKKSLESLDGKPLSKILKKWHHKGTKYQLKSTAKFKTA
jgi:hypothetical protein